MARKELLLEGLFDDIDQVMVDQPCTDQDLCKISSSIPRWEGLTPNFELDEVEVEDIKETNSSPPLRRLAMLRKWKQKKGKKATYRSLAKVLVSHGLKNVAEMVCDLIKSRSSHHDAEGHDTSVVPCMASYGDYLRGVYQTDLTSSLDMDILPSPTLTVFNLALISHKRVEYGDSIKTMLQLLQKCEVNEILDEKKEVQLEELFQLKHPAGGRRFILLEGAPGAGKSTLACLICRKWGAGELFQEFTLVVFVSLSDRAIQCAQSLPELLDTGSCFDTQEVATHLQSLQGRGVLFVLDGWDEYAPQLKSDSLVAKLICSPGKLSLHSSSIMVTSRPVASGQLQRYCSARVEIVGFKQEELTHYFQEALDNDHDTIAKLEQCLLTKPLIKKSCYLPLNACIIAHVFLSSDGSLPSTIYDVYKLLLHKIVRRHLEKLGQECSLPQNEELYLEKLPSPFQEHFEVLCKLAYKGVTSNQTTFSDEDLKSYGIHSPNEMLGLLHGVASFRAKGQSLLYSFVHLTIQELLATLYILRLPVSEQFEAFEPLFGQPRFVAVLQFYASSTKELQQCQKHASQFAWFLSEVFKHHRSRVDKLSQQCPRKWLCDLNTFTSSSFNSKEAHLALWNSATHVEASSIPQALSSADPFHAVLYCPLPCFDVGYFLGCCSVSRDMEIKLDICACFSDDVMLYCQLGGVQLPTQGQTKKANTAPTDQAPPPYLYRLFDLVDFITSQPGYDASVKEQFQKSLSVIEDSLIVLTYVSPILYCRMTNLLDGEADMRNCYIIANYTGEMEHFQEQSDNLCKLCNIQ